MESMHGVPTRIQSFNDHTGEIAPFKTVLVRTEESARTQAEAPSYSPRLDSDELQAPVGRVDEALESEPFVSRENVLVQPDDAAVLNVLQGEGGARLVARINGASQMEIAKIVHAINLDLTADGRGLLDATVNGHDVVLNLDRTGTN
ncbi:hypothetical protein WJ33_21275 [Burkholderia ubonensis]|uniref:Uncharacterized protein n=2 Tax=Burkholderia ubonensis TaxID=101571 RepID=A0A103RNL9_9BURK|nr:hypothetical protein WJ33_21275 [Burkholderia ubonensis]